MRALTSALTSTLRLGSTTPGALTLSTNTPCFTSDMRTSVTASPPERIMKAAETTTTQSTMPMMRYFRMGLFESENFLKSRGG